MDSGNRFTKGSFFLQPIIFKYLECKLISSTDYVVYSFLCERRRNETNKCWPSHGFIAKKIGVSRPTVSASIGRLVELKLIKIVSRYDYRVAKSYTYEIIVQRASDEKCPQNKYPSPEEIEELSIQNFHALMKKIKNSG